MNSGIQTDIWRRRPALRYEVLILVRHRSHFHLYRLAVILIVVRGRRA
jgi:hypothetical protein